MNFLHRKVSRRPGAAGPRAGRGDAPRGAAPPVQLLAALVALGRSSGWPAAMPPGGRGLPSRWCPALPEGVTGAAKGPLAAVLTAGPSAHQPAAGRGRTLSRSFPARPESVAAARRCLAAFMAGSPASSDSLVCLSELATNAISHSRSARSGGRFTVTARRTPAGWHVAVHDAGGPWQPGQDRDGTGHRGLAIVAALAARWGIEPRSEPGSEAGSEPGRTVWFEIGDVPG